MLLVMTLLIVMALGAGLYGRHAGARYATHSFGVGGLLLAVLILLALNNEL